MMPAVAFLLTGLLVSAAILGVPLIALVAGAAGGGLLATRSLPWALAALAVGVIAEFLAIRTAPARNPTFAQAGALVVLGRVLGAAAGAGVWMAAVAPGMDPGLAQRDLLARGLRTIGVLGVLALVAAAT